MQIESNLSEEALGRLREDNMLSEYYQSEEPFCMLYKKIDHAGEAVFEIGNYMPKQYYKVKMSREEAAGQMKGIVHQHNFFECFYVVRGTVYQIIENERHLYIPGSACLLNRKTRHMLENGTDYEVVFLQFSGGFLERIRQDLLLEEGQSALREFLAENLGENVVGKEYLDFVPEAEDVHRNKKVEALFKELSELFKRQEKGILMETKYRCVKFFQLLECNKVYDTRPVSIGTEEEERIYAAVEERMKACAGCVARGMLEEELHYSAAHINRIVKKYTGLSLYQYGMTFRMKRAAEWLTGTKKTVGEIAAELGFENRSNFYHQFEKVYHMTPAAYRKKWK